MRLLLKIASWKCIHSRGSAPSTFEHGVIFGSHRGPDFVGFHCPLDILSGDCGTGTAYWLHFDILASMETCCCLSIPPTLVDGHNHTCDCDHRCDNAKNDGHLIGSDLRVRHC